MANSKTTTIVATAVAAVGITGAILLNKSSSSAAATAVYATTQDQPSGWVEFPRSLPGNNQDVLSESDGTQCGLAGSGKGGKPVSAKFAALDTLKNRHTPPTNMVTMSLGDMLNAKVDDPTMLALQAKNAGTSIVAYLKSVKLESAEQCNCESLDDNDHDFHCVLVANPNDPATAGIIAEVTPRCRYWSLEQMQSLVGKQIRVTGYIMIDFEHKPNSEADNPGNPRNWRGSCIEIHCITDLEVQQ